MNAREFLGGFLVPTKNFNLSRSVYDYLLANSLRESEVLTQLRQETARHRQGTMQIAPDQGQFMAMLVELMGAKKILEIGTFTGYSALWLAQAIPDDGLVITCDVNQKYTDIARRYWHMAGVDTKIELRLAPAIETLEQLFANEVGTFDFVFIDADKKNYEAYYEKSLQLLRKGGLIAIDNTLWEGKVANPNIQDQDTQVIRSLNHKIHQDKRVNVSLLSIADGLTIVLKK